MKIRLLKMVDRVAGRLAVSLLPPAGRCELTEPRRILVIRPGGMGDAVLLVPALLALKQAFPRAELTVLAERRNAGVFQLCAAVDRLLLYDRPAHLLEVLRTGYDLVIDTEQWHRLSAVVARLTRAPVCVGFGTNERKRLFTHRVGYSHDDYELESFLRLLEPLGIRCPGIALPFLSVPGAAIARAASLLPLFCCKSFVTIFPGASIPQRRWGAGRFSELAQSLAAAGVPVVVVGGKEDRAEGEAIVAGCGGLNLAGKTSLSETAAVIAHAALLVSGDSGVLHLAVGLGVPTVSLFGPGIQRKWGPKGEHHVVLNKELPCSPCTRFGTTPPCSVGARCMSEITVQEAHLAVMRSMGRA